VKKVLIDLDFETLTDAEASKMLNVMQASVMFLF